MWKLFSTISTLSDPYTQPSDTGDENEYILSMDMVSDLVLALMQQVYEDDPELRFPVFDMSVELYTIIEKILKLVNSDEEARLISVNNDEDNWIANLSKWLPHDSLSNITNLANDYHNLKLLYTIASVSILTIYKLYKPGQNISLHPFLSQFLQIWKNQTHVILLGLEIDRRDEELNFPGYPEVIRHVIKGSSALRSIIALILNNEFDKRLHDLKHESLNNFMNPWGRKAGNGSITADLRIYVAGMFSLGLEYPEVNELMEDFEPEDKYDEDIKYMFEMEMDDADAELEADEYHNHHHHPHHHHHHAGAKTENKIHELDENDNKICDEEMDEPYADYSNGYELHPSCDCIFDEFDEEYYEEEEDYDEEAAALIKANTDASTNESEISTKHSISNKPVAVRSAMAKNLKFDGEGNDWRDMPRGSNIVISSDFHDLLKKSRDDPSVFFTSPLTLLNELRKLCSGTMPDDVGEKVIRSVAWIVRYEYEASLMTEDEREERGNDPGIHPDIIYTFISDGQNFEDMVKHNPSISFCIIDELMMAEGYRRVLIWFLTHLELNQWLINYFHELLVGLRGNPPNSTDPKNTRFKFSRQGALELSEVEKSMLLHEFFSNAGVYLSRGTTGGEESDSNDNDVQLELEGDTRPIASRTNAQKLMMVICLMLKSLESKGVLKVNDPEYRVEIQTLLVQWVGVGLVTGARELFFKSNEVDDEQTETATFLKSVSLETKRLKEMYTNMSGVNFFDIFAKNFEKDSFEFLTMLLNLGNFYFKKRSEILQFFKDLNNVEKQFSGSELNKVCDNLFKGLNFFLLTDSSSGILTHLKKFKLLDDSYVETATEIIDGYLNGFLNDDSPNYDRFTQEDGDEGDSASGGEGEGEDEEQTNGAEQNNDDTKKKQKKKKKTKTKTKTRTKKT